MPPVTRSRAIVASGLSSSGTQDRQESSSTDDDSDYNDNSDFEEDSLPGVVRSPTRLLYNLDQLPDMGRATVRDVFNEPPKIALQRCRRIGNTYAFQMTELVTRSVRIRSSESTSGSSRLSCSCGQEDKDPCSHLLWLLDQLLKQTLYNHDESKALNMTRHGYAEEMGDPFCNISDFHLDILANALHCPVVNPDPYADDDEEIDHHRVLEARELLASVYKTTPEEFRRDIFTHPTVGDHIIRRDDMDYTIFRMLLDNHHFFQYFLSLLSPTDYINDLFRKLSQRVDHVLRQLDSFLSSTCSPSPANSVNSCDMNDQTPATNAIWAARHLLGIVGLIRSSIYNRDQPLQPNEALSAAHTLVHILSSVVARNSDTGSGRSQGDCNLYMRLIGDRGGDGFVIAELDLLPEAASHLVDRLGAILEQIGLQGAPTTYITRFRSLLGRLRTSSAGGAGSKRSISDQGDEHRSKRMK
ncbi:SWIM zinc finger family protein [Pochonia chlamydosporia 170]|uniref:SWIM zinc finger family protein n=1 Tax=Pochonia chlamydosporia 170 TaxID=1380566 RepID=A0A179G3K7_METCM|nr:SWIM zinc finger family protein [Pochonia chlamydosporia 170]OAQ72454.1 SWIM zinc finger family protein [Pochonia chlamydosporia 170]